MRWIILLMVTVFHVHAQEEQTDFGAVPVGGSDMIQQVLETQLTLPKPLLTDGFAVTITAYFDIDSLGNAVNVQLEGGTNNLLRKEILRMLRFLKFTRTHRKDEVQPYFLVFTVSTDSYKRYLKQKVRHKVKALPADSSYIVYARATTSPEYYRNGDQGLVEYFTEHLVYPRGAIEKSIEGTVVTEFIVETNGFVTDAHVRKGLGAGCSEEALSLIKKTRWHPAELNGKLVRYRMTYPITFNLRENKRGVSTAQSID